MFTDWRFCYFNCTSLHNCRFVFTGYQDFGRWYAMRYYQDRWNRAQQGTIRQATTAFTGPRWRYIEGAGAADGLLHPGTGKHCQLHGAFQGLKTGTNNEISN